MNIRLVKQEDLDKQLYNSCIHYATNGNIYGYDWFLNATAKEWDVLVEGDKWVSVMPLPRRKNWLGRTYLEQPRLVPELAVYTVKPISPKRIQSFWDAVPEEYRSGELTVEPASVPQKPGRFDVEAAPGTVLFLKDPYETIIGDFSPAYHEGLLRAEDAELRPIGSFKPETFADLWLEVNGKTADNEWTYHAMQRIMYQVLHRSWGGTQAVQDKKGNILAMVFLVYSHSRIFPLYQVETPAGKKVGAMTYLWDNILKMHAERNLKLKREDILV
ncbi:hypothetical protein [Neolewinella antarctica]|uniref:Uncharacterized protein n=1 Tax=Neolewinella antarctica TaxID=442734 RepID=A0ABX0XI34_9BACT|nr:hypothetical protein [Neolewinella antarctica]NJC28413.1 hypothetical protein [Neolewinella antarctica]